MTRLVIYSAPGTAQHGALCDAFLANGGWYVSAGGSFWEVLTMTSGWGPGGDLTRWLLSAPAAVGRA